MNRIRRHDVSQVAGDPEEQALGRFVGAMRRIVTPFGRNTRSVLLAFAVGFALPVWAAELEFSTHEVLEGDSVTIRVVKARAGQRITIHAQSRPVDAGDTVSFWGHAVFVADANGVVDLATAAPVDGDYDGADLRGLFWSQRRVNAEMKAELATAGLAALTPQRADRVVLTLQEDGRLTNSDTLELIPNLPEVRREDVRQGELVGAFYSLPGTKKRPVVVILSGSEGGLAYADWLGPKLASRGYAAFGLAYFDPDGKTEGVPTALNRIPVERLEQARAWLGRRREADVSRFGVVGASKGGEFALVLASIYDWIDVAVGFVPADEVWQGFRRGPPDGIGSSWSHGGVDLPFIPNPGLRDEILRGRQPGEKIHMARVHRESRAAATPEMLAAARIPIERSRADLLLLGGADDQTGDSGDSVLRAGATLRAAGYRHNWLAKSYEGAGHLIVDTGWRPTTTHGDGPFFEGGSPAADARAQADGWEKMLAALKRALKP